MRLVEKIYFYSKSRKYFEFSNFSNHPIEMNGKIYPTNEHYFQAMKFIDKDYAEEIRLAYTPAQAKKMGLSRDYKIHVDWDERRIEVMQDAIEAKFVQHPELQVMLLETGNKELIEDSPTDYFWGCGKNRTGENKLGKLLMYLRAIIHSQNAGW